MREAREEEDEAEGERLKLTLLLLLSPRDLYSFWTWMPA
jgi:hypothetical protein